VHLKDYCPTLIKALLLNLSHQQQKIRVSALQAIGAIVPINPTILKETLPSVAKLNLDRTHQLREQVLHVACVWGLMLASVSYACVLYMDANPFQVDKHADTKHTYLHQIHTCHIIHSALSRMKRTRWDRS